uniref:Si:ch211-176g6.2 n=1 Tax=Sparus aurata TaxID=8175 RepID=A0A671VJ33_SPAAU
MSILISADVLREDDPSELSNQITAPGILKIFGNEICEGAHYKSVLATTHSSAKELVKEALDRYGLSKEEAESYVLCDTIGSTGNHQWRTEGFRVVGDNEKPLLLQSLWKPREGLARRFEILRRSLVEEKTSKDKDTITAGTVCDCRLRNHTHGLAVPSEGDGGLHAKTETLCPPRPRGKREGEESEREETESSDDNTTQYSIHPPQDCPYLLLLQGCSLAQDFVIYLLAEPNIVFGGENYHEDSAKPDILLFAADIYPRHCCFQRHSAGSPTVLHPCPNATVTRNGEVLSKEVQLNPGDVIGLGQHYLFLFKDPLASAHKERVRDSKVRAYFTCANSKLSQNRVFPFLKSADGRSLTLRYRSEDEHRIVREIVATGSSSIKDRPPLTAAFLLCLCLQYSSICLHTSDMRRLLLLIASGVQSAMWVSRGEKRPCLLVVRYATLLELRLSCVRSASEETMAVLEEVIMLAFQQCVYYITKVLYPILPDLLDCNPFRESPDLRMTRGSAQVLSSVGLQVPVEIQHLVEVLTDTRRLLSDCQLHPEISSQLMGYLFYFINASLFNSLMERGSEPGFYQWSTGVRLRASLDFLLDWAHAAGLGELALEHTQTLSSSINLLATPWKNLLQTSWASLRSDYPALSPAQLNHLLSLYSPASPCTHTWCPSVHEQAAAQKTADVLESFDTLHPLVLPDGGYQFELGKDVADLDLLEELDKLKEFISKHSDSASNEVTATEEQKV